MSTMENKSPKFLVESTVRGVIELKIEDSKPISDAVQFFEFDEYIVSNFTKHLSIRPHSIRPNNSYFKKNLHLLLTNFNPIRSSWFLEYLQATLRVKESKTNDIVSWISALDAYNMEYSPKLTEELTYLKSLLEYSNAVFVDTLTKKDAVAQKEAIKLIEKVVTGKGVPITSSIKVDNTLASQIAEGLGHEYNAHLMLHTQLKSEKRNLYLIHSGVYAWLRALPSGPNLYSIELAASMTLAAITPLLIEGKVTPLNLVGLSPLQLLDQIKKGVIIFDDLNPKQKALVAPLLQNQTFVAIKETFYMSFLRKLKEIAEYCNYEQKWEEEMIPEMMRGESEESSSTTLELTRQPTAKKSVKGWQERLDNLAREVIKAIRKPIMSETSKGKKTKDRYANAIASAIKACFIFTTDFNVAKGMETMENKKGDNKELDPRQRDFVMSILNGLSTIISWPTSSGKTYASFVAIDGIFRDKKAMSLVYVAPNFYQSLQAYCGMVKTFPTQKFGLITGIANIIPPDCKNWVGTPEQLWVFAKSSKMFFDIGIIDEIHVISTPPNATTEEINKAQALSRIVSLITKQFIGLSATINREDEIKLVNFVQNILDSSRALIPGHADITPISVSFQKRRIVDGKEEEIERFIPLISEVFTGKDIIPLTKKSSSSGVFGYNPIADVKNIPVTPENTFNLMKLLDNSEMTPALIFDLQEKDSYTLFGKLIKYIHDRHTSEYVIWNRIKTLFNKDIKNFNKKIRGNINEKNKAENAESQSKQKEDDENRSKKGGAKKKEPLEKIISVADATKEYEKLRVERMDKLNEIVLTISMYIRDSFGIKEEEIKPKKDLPLTEVEEKENSINTEDVPITKLVEEKDKPIKKSTRPRRPLAILSTEAKLPVLIKIKEKTIEVKSEMSSEMVEVSSHLRELAPSLTKGKAFQLPSKISYEIKDIYNELIELKSELAISTLREIPLVCLGVGSYFKFKNADEKIGKKLSDKNVFSSMTTTGSTEQMSIKDRNAYNITVTLSDAEGVEPDDVRQIFKLMDLALSFGIGILIPTMPFSVQYQILKMLDEGTITIVFASESMSMGVNFPARTCVIRSITNSDANPGKVIQMQGRAGRRGESNDKEGYSVSWNITNITDIDSKNPPKLYLNQEDVHVQRVGLLVRSHTEVAIKINEVMSSVDNLGTLKETAKSLELVTAKITKKKGDKDDEDEDTTSVQHTELVEYDDMENQEGKMQPFSLDPTVLDSIKQCMAILCQEIGIIDDTFNKLIKRIEFMYYNSRDDEMFRDPYYWVEKINLVKIALQEVHTALHKRACVPLLDYISTLYSLIHRLSMRYAGLVYQKASTKSIK
jgi:Lhr-like helicase